MPETSTTGGGEIRRRIVLGVEATRPNLAGFNAVHRALDHLKSHVASVNAAINSIGSPSASAGAAIERSIARHHKALGSLASGYKDLGVDAKNAAKHLRMLHVQEDLYPGEAKGKTSGQNITDRIGNRTTKTRYRRNPDTQELEAVGASVTDRTDYAKARREAERAAAAKAKDQAERERNLAKTEGVSARERRAAEVANAQATVLANKDAERAAAAKAKETAERERNFAKTEGLRAKERRAAEVASAQDAARANADAAKAEARDARRRFSESRRAYTSASAIPTREEYLKSWARGGGGGGSGGGPGGGRGEGRLLMRGLRGFTPAGFATNALTVGGWTGAVGAVYGGIGLAKYSYSRMENIQLQQARLTQVFRSVGGSAKELTDDVLKLAVAEGRGTDEAMQSAIAWSRLGLTRKQVAEATRVSLMAANVAEMSAADTTQHFAAIMAGFNLEASELAMVLGMLNQSSNTYRVTVAELLQGLSRVGGVAQQAGMSLADLQGILAVTVQKTGQSGANMANALKTVLVRMNRPDVNEFLTQRGGFNPTGSAEDLSKVYELYIKSNDAQQRDILLKIGSATQANRLRAILETYPEALNAAIQALSNLNSAEQENIKITNTAASARQRLVSSWDRFVNAPAVERASAGFFNNAAGMLSGITPTYNQRDIPAKYFNADKSTGLGAVMGAMRYSPSKPLLQVATMGMYDRFTDWFQGYRQTPQTGEQKFTAEALKINELQGRGESSMTKSRLLELVARTYGNRDAAGKSALEKSLTGVASSEAIAALRGGDSSKLTAEADAAKQRSETEFASAQAAREASAKRIREEMEKLPATDKKRLELAKDLESVERSMVDASHRRSQEIDDELSNRQAILAVMMAQREVAKGISGAFQGMGLSSYTQELATAEAQLAAMNAMKEAAVNNPRVTPDAKQKIDDEQYEADQRVRALRGAGRGFAEFGVRRDMSASLTRAEFGEGVGANKGEQLLEQRQRIKNELMRLSMQENRSLSDQVRQTTLLSELNKTELSLSERVLANRREQRQVVIETAREYQKSLIGSGPGELLRKLAAFQLNRRGMTSGGFWALSGESQRDVYSLRGGDRMADLRAEQASLTRGGTLNEAALVNTTNHRNNVAGQIASAMGPAMDVAGAAARAIADSLGSAARSSAEIARNMGAAAQSSANTRTATSPNATPPAQGGAWTQMENDYRNSNWSTAPAASRGGWQQMRSETVL